MSSTSHYEVYGTLPTLTEKEKQDLLSAKELPSVSSSDNGKVLMVDSGAWTKKAIPSQLPSVTAEDDGNLLTVVSGKWEKAAAPVELPSVTAEDDGKVLKVVNGAWTAVLEE